MAENSNGFVTDPSTTGKLPVVAADAAPGKGEEALFRHLEDLVDSLPDMEARSARLAKARAAASIEGLIRAKLTADAELAEADKLVEQAEERLLRATSPLAAGDDGESVSTQTSEPESSEIDEAIHSAQEQVLHAGLLRGMRIGPANNAAAELAEALENSPFETVEEARAAMISPEEIALIEQQIADYQRDYNETLAACQSAEQAGHARPA